MSLGKSSCTPGCSLASGRDIELGLRFNSSTSLARSKPDDVLCFTQHRLGAAEIKSSEADGLRDSRRQKRLSVSFKVFFCESFRQPSASHSVLAGSVFVVRMSTALLAELGAVPAGCSGRGDVVTCYECARCASRSSFEPEAAAKDADEVSEVETTPGSSPRWPLHLCGMDRSEVLSFN